MINGQMALFSFAWSFSCSLGEVGDFLTKKLGVTFMWDWKENIEHCFFTNHLDDHLKEFLNSQKPLSSNEELWEFVFKSAWEWGRKHSVDFVRVIMRITDIQSQ